MRLIKNLGWMFGLLLCMQMQAAFAIDKGLFFGFDLGVTQSQDAEVKTVTDLSVVPAAATTVLTTLPIDEDNDSFGGRFFFGYRFNKYFAMLMGVSQLQILDASEDDKKIAVKPHAHADATLDATAIDLSAEGTLPLGDKFYLFARGGVGGVSYKSKLDVKDAMNMSLVDKSKTKGEFMPSASAGFGFMPSQYFSVGAFYTRFFGTQDLPDVDMYGLMFTIHFSEKRNFCGEILC